MQTGKGALNGSGAMKNKLKSLQNQWD